MEARNRFIAPERMGTWLVTTLGVALVALLVAVFGLREAKLSAVVAQVEVIKLNERIAALEAKQMQAQAQPAAAVVDMSAAAPAEAPAAEK